MIFEKHVVRKIFVLYSKKVSREKIVKLIKKYYHIQFGRETIRKELQKYFGKNQKKKNINGFRLNFIKRVYTHTEVSSEKIVKYINTHFEDKTTVQALNTLMSLLKIKKLKRRQPDHIYDISKSDEREIIKLYLEEKLSAKK